MPGLPPKPNNQVAIPSGQQNNVQEVQQPRQPHNMESLLRFAIEANELNGSAAGQQARPLDEERKAFLEEALQSMTVNVTAVMKKQIEILKDVENIPEDEIPEKLSAFDEILEYIDNIDIACDFHKINGFAIFDPCLKCRHHQIRAAACDLLAELAQNNDYIQTVICNCTNLMPTLLRLLDDDSSDQVKIKAVYAISCVTRDSDLGYQNFIHHNGLRTCLKALTKENDKLRTKITFLLTALLSLDLNLSRKLLDLNYLPLLVYLIKGEWSSSDEHVLSLLCSLAEKDDEVRKELQRDNYNLEEVINKHLEIVKGKDEYKEEQAYCDSILKIVFHP